jgi:hypothetical protein
VWLSGSCPNRLRFAKQRVGARVAIGVWERRREEEKGIIIFIPSKNIILGFSSPFPKLTWRNLLFFSEFGLRESQSIGMHPCLC